MPVKKTYESGRSFIPAEKGAEYADYDLSGEQQRTRELFDILNQQNTSLAKSLTRDLRRLLNHESLSATSSSWTIAEPDQADFWLKAFPADDSGNAVLLGMDKRSMFSLSELFFGGEPEKLTDKQLEKRQLADTERRLTNRLLDTVLRTLCPKLGYPLDDWHSSWVEPDAPLPVDTCWTELTVASEDWQLIMYLVWPLALSRQNSTGSGPDAETFRSGMARALRGVATRLTVEVASMELQLGELANLKPGDILPLDLKGEATARSSDTDCLRGTICENGDQLALRVTRHVGVMND